MSDLARKTVDGATLNVSVILFKTMLQFVVVLPILARVIPPEQFGYVGMAMAFVSLFTMFNDLGISAALVRADEPSPAFWSTAFWTNIGLGAVMTLAIFLAAPLIAGFYREPVVEPLVQALAVMVLMHCAFLVPMAWLQRNFRFRAIAGIDLVATLISAVVAVVAAFQDHGMWALVWQQLVLYAVKMLGGFAYQHAPLHLTYRFSEIVAVLPFSLRLTGEAFVTFINRNADNILIGRYLGAEPLGFYGRAYQIMLVPVSSLSLGAGFALYPAMSSIKNETGRLKTVYLRSLSILGGVSIPMMTGLALVSAPFVALVFGPKWSAVVPVLSILAFAGTIQTLLGPSNVMWKSLGRSDVLLRWALFRMVAFVAAFVAGIQLGSITTLSLAYLIANIVMYLPFQWMTLRHIGVTFGEFTKAMAPTLVSTLVMAGAILAVREGVPGFAGLPSYLQLGALVAVGAAAFNAAILALFRPFVTELAREAKGLMSRGKGAAPAK